MAAQWFNPFCHLAYRRFRSALETSADQRVMELSGGRSLDYGDALLETLDMDTSPAMPAIGIAEDKSELKRRILMIRRFKQQKAFTVAVLAVVAGASLLAVAGGVGAETSMAAQSTPDDIVANAITTLQLAKKDAISDSGLFEKAKGTFKISVPGDYCQGKGFRTGYNLSIQGKDLPTPLFLYVIAEVKANTPQGERTVHAAKAWQAQGHFPLFFTHEFAGLLTPPGDYTLKTTFHIINASGDGLLKLGLATQEGDNLLVRQSPLDAATAAKAVETLEAAYPHCQVDSQNTVRSFATIPADYFKLIPPTPELDKELKAGFSSKFGADDIFMIRYDRLPCNVFARVEYQLRGDRQWHKYDVFSFMGSDGEKGLSTSIGSYAVKLPPETDEVKLKFLPASAKEAWHGNMMDYYGGTIETDWIKLGAPSQNAKRGSFMRIPPSADMDAKIKAGLSAFAVANGNSHYFMINYSKLPCNLIANVEYQVKGSSAWGKFGPWLARAGAKGMTSAALPPNAKELRLKLTPLSEVEALQDLTLPRIYYGGVVETDWITLAAPAKGESQPAATTKKVVPQPIAPSPAMDAAIKRAVLPKLRFQRQVDGSLELEAGVDSAPCDLAFVVYGKRFRGSGDTWEAFSSFARPSGKSTLHHSSSYAFFSGLEGDKAYKFKFKFTPNKNLAAGGEAEGMPGYYNGEVETDWVELDVPPFSFGPLNGCSGSSVAFDKQETVRDDALFNKEWQSFKVSTNYGGEYWIGAGGFLDNEINTWPFKYQPEKPGAFCLRVVELQTKDAKEQTRTAYQLSYYRLYHNTGFPLYQLDGLFPEPGDYQFGGKVHFLSMSGDDLVKENLAAKLAGGDSPFSSGSMASVLRFFGLLPAQQNEEESGRFRIANGDMDAAQAAPLLERLKQTYPCHSVDLPGAAIKALRK